MATSLLLYVDLMNHSFTRDSFLCLPWRRFCEQVPLQKITSLIDQWLLSSGLVLSCFSQSLCHWGLLHCLGGVKLRCRDKSQEGITHLLLCLQRMAAMIRPVWPASSLPTECTWPCSCCAWSAAAAVLAVPYGAAGWYCAACTCCATYWLGPWWENPFVLALQLLLSVLLRALLGLKDYQATPGADLLLSPL